MTAILTVENLAVAFRKEGRSLRVVEDVSFVVKPGETLGIVGESGCGKSVTVLSVMGLLPKGTGRIEQGIVQFAGKNLAEFDDEQFARIRGKEIAMIFQDPMTSLNPVFTIGNQILEIIMEHTDMNKKQAYQHGVNMLKKVGIPRAEEVMKEYPHQLSGGMRQRVVIAIAMSCSPKLLIADEPTTALDVTIQAQILDLMQELKKEAETSIIMITHDLGVVAEICDRVLVMYAGKVVEEADVRSIFRNPHHPYTIDLMNSIPSLTEERNRLFSIKGTVPLPEEMPKGCRFSPRCSQVKQECFHIPPERQEVQPNHFVSCWLYS